MGSDWLMGIGFLWADENILELDSREDYRASWIY